MPRNFRFGGEKSYGILQGVYSLVLMRGPFFSFWEKLVFLVQK